MHLRNARGLPVMVLAGVLIFIVTLTVASAASAQTKKMPRLGVGLSLLQGHTTVAGIAAGVVFPVKDIGVRSIGVVGAASFHHSREDQVSLSAVGFGGGIRLTRTWRPTLRTFLQAVMGGVQRRETELGDLSVRTDVAFTFGGGLLVPLNGRFNFMAEADLGIINDTVGDTNKGLLVMAGVSMPLGKQ